MPLLAAVPVNDALFFDLVYKGDINNNGKLDNAEIGNLMTIGKPSGWDCATKGATIVPGQDPVQIENLKVMPGYWLQSSVTN